MNLRRKIFQLCCCANLVIGLMASHACAFLFVDRSLENIKYDLSQGKEIALEQLVQLAERGDHGSQRFLADRLLERGNQIDQARALYWYQKSFDQGRGDLAVLVPIVGIFGVSPLHRKEVTPWLKKAITQFDFYTDLVSVDAVLEIFYYFPNLIPKEQVESLIKIHRRSCIDSCLGDLYSARLLETNKKIAPALALYKKAIRINSRAVGRYFELLGDERSQKFRQLATELEPLINDLIPESIAAIGENLINSAEYNNGKPLHDTKVDLWLDQAIKQKINTAYKSKIQYVFIFPSFYSKETLEGLIDGYAKQSALWAKYYRGLSYLVLEWRNIEPQKARQVFEGLLEREFWPAYLGLATLKSSGMEDEVDHIQAINIYEAASQKGVVSADYQVAVLYGRSKGICRDYVKAYAHNSLAITNGVLAAVAYKNILQGKISVSDIKLAERYAEQLTAARM